MRRWALIVSILVPLSATAANPFANGNPAVGKTLVEQSCNSCHASLQKGDPNKIYTRGNRKVKSAQQLLSQIRACNTNTNAGWFPEDEINAGAYLNQAFYNFP